MGVTGKGTKKGVVSSTWKSRGLQEGFLEKVTLGLILEGSIDVCQISKVGVGIAGRVEAERWEEHVIFNDVQGIWEAGEGLESDYSFFLIICLLK